MTKQTNLTAYNLREAAAVNKRKAANMTDEERAMTQKEINIQRDLELAEMEEKLGVDDSKTRVEQKPFYTYSTNAFSEAGLK